MVDFFTEWFTKVVLGLYDGVKAWVQGWLDIYNAAVNGAIEKASASIIASGGPNGSLYTEARGYIHAISDNVFVPLAAMLLTFFFCWQMISVMQESNRLNNITPENILMILLKLCICLLVVSKSWDIVSGFFDIGSWAAERVQAVFSFSDVSASITPSDLGLIDYTEADGAAVIAGGIFRCIAAGMLTMFATIAIMCLGLFIRFKVYLWIYEWLIFAAGSPIPLSTFINKEWGQMGTNYLRKMLALSFNGVFMLLCMTTYAVIANKLFTSGNVTSILGSVMAMLATCLLISKVGSISESIFNAH